MTDLLLTLILLLGTNMGTGENIPLPDSETFNGHTSTVEVDVLCHTLLPEHERRDCQRVSLCESGSNPDAIGVNANGTRDLGAWQHHEPLIQGRLNAIGIPDGDPFDVTVNALMTQYLWGALGGRFGTSAGWYCAPVVGAR